MDFNLYDVSYDSFSFFLDTVELSCDSEESFYGVVLDFLTNTNSKCNTLFLNIFNEYKIDVDLNEVKRIIMLMIASKSYIMRTYDEQKGINSYSIEDIKREFDNLDYMDVLDYFYSKDDIVLSWIEDFNSYIKRPYIFQSMSKSIVIKNNLLSELLSINPFEVLSLGDHIKDDSYLQSEIAIQQFFDIYDMALLEFYGDEIDEDKDEFFANLFLKKLEEQNINMNEFILYTISNVYETLSIAIVESCSEYYKYKWLKKKIEDSSTSLLLSYFYNDATFRIGVIDVFVMSNESLIEGDLISKRNTFKSDGNTLVLKRLNPYYLEEEIVYKRVRKSN